MPNILNAATSTASTGIVINNFVSTGRSAAGRVVRKKGSTKARAIKPSSKGMDGKKIALGLGILAVSVGAVAAIYAHNKHKREEEELRRQAMGFNGNPYHATNGQFTSAENAAVVTHGDCKITDDVICHYGVVGQKWGIRKYQNEDGSLTRKGERSYIEKSKVSGANKGGIAGALLGGAAATALTLKSSSKKGKPITVGKLGRSIVSGMLAGGLGGMFVGKIIGKRKGKADVADYGKKYIMTKFEEPTPPPQEPAKQPEPKKTNQNTKKKETTKKTSSKK